MIDRTPEVVVIGAGAAGFLAAATAASGGKSTLLLERNPRPGVKIRIAGGGKCNVTHDGTVDDLLGGFPKREARFLKYALHSFSNTNLRDLLRRYGVETIVRDDGRVFPASLHAGDVVNALLLHAERSGARLCSSVVVSGLRFADNAIAGVETSDGFIASRTVVVATGGASYAKTGTTGDGFRWAAAAGHTIVPVLPALAPIIVAPVPPASWRGVALRDGMLIARSRDRVVASWEGDLLFTHEGLSGPAALETSRDIAAALANGPVSLFYDFLPAQDDQSCDRLLIRLIEEERNKNVSTIIDTLLPGSVVEGVMRAARIPPDRRASSLSRDERRKLAATIKSWPLGVVARIDRDRGEVTAGGVSLDEIDPRTMQSRRVAGLFFAGEVLDVAGRVGGYNLQAAFSTGFVAGTSCARP
jgi:predicted Rossmann fold flavoprotein